MMGTAVSRARGDRQGDDVTAARAEPHVVATAQPECRPGCGACCTAPSISSAIPGMPAGKPAGVPCVQLLDDMRCAIFGDPRRPAVCASLQPSFEMCGESRAAAMTWLTRLEAATAP